MKKICLLLLLAFCMSFGSAVSVNADVDYDSDYLYINGVKCLNIDYYEKLKNNGKAKEEISVRVPDFRLLSCFGYSFTYEVGEYKESLNARPVSLNISHADGRTGTRDTYLYCFDEKDGNCFIRFVPLYEYSSGKITIHLCICDMYIVYHYQLAQFDLNVSDIDFTEPALTMTLNNVSDPLTDEFYVEAVNGYSERGFIKTQYQANADDDYTAVNELIVPADTTTRFTAKELNVTKAGRYTFTLYDPGSMLKGVQVLEITSDYVAPDDGSGGGSDDDTDEDLFNFIELPEDANILDYIKWICINMIELFKGLGRCIKKFVTQTREMSSILTKFFSFMPAEFTLILTLGMMFLVLLRFLGR